MAVTSEANEGTGSTTLSFRSTWVRQRAKDVGFPRIEDLATAAGITRQQMHRILAGEYHPNAETARALAKALRCMIEDLHEELPTGSPS